MSMHDLEGVRYGPVRYRTDPEKVAEYAAAVGGAADPSRVPPSLAGALLFCVAPHLLGDERAADSARSVIHGDQSFTWHRPIPLAEELAVTGTVTKVRERGGVFFTVFELAVSDTAGPVLGGASTFLLAGLGTAPAAGGDERTEPEPEEGSRAESTGALADEPATAGWFSASRADLVRYAGASRDWNPIHWDHAAAVAAGLQGIVVHGLLQSAWVVEAACRAGITPHSARFRYKRPLGAAVEARLVGSRRGTGAQFELGDDEGAFLTAAVDGSG